jgi:phosphohistidine phosphatase
MDTKTIYLLRHGKADWGIGAAKDIDREVLLEGINRTKQIAKYLKENNVKIDLVISSPAVRAIQTANIIKEELNLPEIIIEDRLYPCEGDGIFNTIIEQNDDYNSILIVGHNPGITYFAREYMYADIDNIHTSGAVGCKYFTKSWSEFLMVDKKLKFAISPKKI